MAIISKHFRQCGSFSNSVTQFDDDPLITNQITKQTRLILANLAYSRVITPKSFIWSGWLSNLAEIFCQQTFLQSLIIIQWKLFKLLSGQMRWTPPATRRTCSHNTSRVFKRAYTNASFWCVQFKEKKRIRFKWPTSQRRYAWNF